MCYFFTPRHPLTHPKLSSMAKAESRLEIDALVEEAVQGTTKVII